MEQAGVQLIAAGGDVYISTLEKSTKVTNTFVSATEQGGGKVSAAGQVIIGALREVGKIAVDAFGAAAKATASFLKDSVSVAGDFEQGMHKFQAVAGAGVDTKGLEKFKDLFISLGKELPVSTSEVEQAAIEMVSGGIDPAIVQAGALRSTIQFAAASGLSLADAAATSAKFLAGWTAASASTADKVAFLTSSTDALTKAAAASSTTAGELRLGIFNVQGAAQALHAPFTDVVATLAELAPAFESSAQAGTALNVFMSRLVPQTDKAAGVMQDLGIITKDGQNIFFDAQGSFLGMANAAEVLKDKLGGMTDAQKIATLHELFGNDAMKVGNLLMIDGAAGVDAMKAKMEAANGVSATAALMQSGYNTALENAKGSVEALQITIGSALLPVLTDLLNNVIAPGVNAFTDWADSIFSAEDPIQALINQIDAFSPLLGTVVAAIADFITSGGDLGVVADDLNEGMAGLGNAFLAVVKTTGAVVSGVQDLVSWFGTADNESSSLGSAVDKLSGVWTAALKVVEDVGAGYMAIARSVLPIVTQFWTTHGADISAFVKTTYDKIISIVTLALQLYDAIVPPILQSVAKWIDDHATGIQSVLTGAWKIISGAIDAALTLIEGIIKLALDVIHGDWKKAWEDLQTMSAGFVLDLQKIISGFLDVIAGFFNTSLAGIAKTWKDNWDMLVHIATETDWAAVGESVVSGIKQGLIDSWDSLMSWFSNKVSDLKNAALDAIGAGSPATEFMPVGQFAVLGMMEGFAATWPQLTDQVAGLSADLVSSMGDIGKNIQQVIADSFGATASIDRQVAKNLEHVGKISDGFRQQFLSYQLRDQQKIAESFADPKAGAAYFKKASENIFELEDLREKLNAAATESDRERIQQQIKLIESAQAAEASQFQAQQATQTNPMLDIANQINEVMKTIAGINLTDDQIKVVSLLSGVWASLVTPIHRAFGGPVAADQPYLVGEQGPELFFPGVSGTIMPAASSMQLMSGGSTTNNNQQSTVNMPIYTNQSPQVLQQSWAVMQAGLI